MLHTLNGEFSRRWFEISKANGLPTDTLEVEPGKAITPEIVDAKLAEGGFDTLCLTDNETSTGIISPVADIAKLVRAKYPDIIILVDAVSCMAGVEIKNDEWGLDVILAGTQKCFALPPGFAVCTVSARAMARAKTVPNRGYYFDFIENEKYAASSTPRPRPASASSMRSTSRWTPCSPKGWRTAMPATWRWPSTAGPGASSTLRSTATRSYASPTVTHITNTTGFDFGALNKELGKRGATDLRRLRPLQRQDLPHRPHGGFDAGGCDSG